MVATMPSSRLIAARDFATEAPCSFHEKEKIQRIKQERIGGLNVYSDHSRGFGMPVSSTGATSTSIKRGDSCTEIHVCSSHNKMDRQHGVSRDHMRTSHHEQEYLHAQCQAGSLSAHTTQDYKHMRRPVSQSEHQRRNGSSNARSTIKTSHLVNAIQNSSSKKRDRKHSNSNWNQMVFKIDAVEDSERDGEDFSCPRQNSKVTANDSRIPDNSTRTPLTVTSWFFSTSEHSKDKFIGREISFSRSDSCSTLSLDDFASAPTSSTVTTSSSRKTRSSINGFPCSKKKADPPKAVILRNEEEWLIEI